MRKPRDIQLNRFASRLTELNKYLTIFPGTNNTKNMVPEELNEILLQSTLSSWARQAYIQGWDFEEITYKDTCNIVERMETAEAIYKGGTPSKNNQQAEANRASFGRKQNVGGAASPSNPEKVRAGKRKRNDAGHLSNALTGAKKTCMLHGLRHSTEECKVLQD